MFLILLREVGTKNWVQKNTAANAADAEAAARVVKRQNPECAVVFFDPDDTVTYIASRSKRNNF